jgi:hypothetical protein
MRNYKILAGNFFTVTALSALLSWIWSHHFELVSTSTLVEFGIIFFIAGFWNQSIAYPLLNGIDSNLDTIYWALLVSLAFTIFNAVTVLFIDVYWSWLDLLWLASGIFILMVFYTNLAVFLAEMTDNVSLSFTSVLFLIFLLSSLPLWLGPFANHFTFLIDYLANINALALLSILADYDYLRSQWFYQFSPMGGLKYVYISKAGVISGYLVLTVCIIAFRHYVTKIVSDRITEKNIS